MKIIHVWSEHYSFKVDAIFFLEDSAPAPTTTVVSKEIRSIERIGELLLSLMKSMLLYFKVTRKARVCMSAHSIPTLQYPHHQSF